MNRGDSRRILRVFDTPEEAAAAAAARFAELAREAVSARGAFSVALAGGGTPRRVYELLASDEWRAHVHWPSVHIFFGDERAVPPDHEESNYRMAREALLARVPVTAANVRPIEGRGDAVENATRYEEDLRAFFGKTDWPRFDLVLLGMGDDGHTASLFPHTPALSEPRAWVVAHRVEKLGAWRVTLTAPAINAARHVLFLVHGAAKAAPLREVLQGPHDPSRLPAQLIRPTDGTLEWLVDEAAAARLYGPNLGTSTA